MSRRGGSRYVVKHHIYLFIVIKIIPRAEVPRISASVLQAPDSVAISGGQFNSTLGHHVTINLNRA